MIGGQISAEAAVLGVVLCFLPLWLFVLRSRSLYHASFLPFMSPSSLCCEPQHRRIVWFSSESV